MYDIEGNVIGAIESIRDITDSKKTQQALLESERKYRTLTDSSLTGIFIHQDGRFVFVNDRFARMHGYTVEELLGMRYLELVHPDDAELVRERVSRRLKGTRVSRRYTIKRLKKDGQTIWCDMMVSLISYAGRPAIMGNVVDVTEKILAEEALLESEQRLRDTIDFLPDATVAVDLEGRVTAWNRAMEEMSGVKAEDMLGKGD